MNTSQFNKDSTLHALTQLSKRISTSFDPRVKFADIVLSNGLYESVIANDYVGSYGFSGRAFDTCFKMGDGDEVVTALMGKAKNDAQLKAGIGSMGRGV